MKCKYCDAEIADNSKFCSNCGVPLNTEGMSFKEQSFITTVLGLVLFVILLILVYVGVNTYFSQPGDELSRTLVYMACAGGIGGTLAALNAFSGYKASKKMDLNFAWWYIFRSFGGIIMGVVVYVLIVSNLLLLEVPAGAVQPSTTLAYSVFAFLAGFAFKQVTNKLKELFATLLPKAQNNEGDKE
jgi:predicted nucleic acid-binding Zn ribbon protein